MSLGPLGRTRGRRTWFDIGNPGPPHCPPKLLSCLPYRSEDMSTLFWANTPHAEFERSPCSRVVTRARPKAPLAGKRSCPTAVPYVAVILLWSTASASLAAAAETRCDCEPPIKAEAIAEGSCVRTQDNGNYCRLRFTTEAAATAALKNGAFQDQLSTAGLKPDTFVVDIKTLEDLP